MKYEPALIEAVLLQRNRKYLAEVAVNQKTRRTIFCPNLGEMRGCDLLGSRIWFSENTHPNSHYRDTWEMVELDGGRMVCINPDTAIKVAAEAIESLKIPELGEFDRLRSAVPFGNNGCIDFLLERGDESYTQTERRFVHPSDVNADNFTFVSVLPVTMGDEIGRGFFPETTNVLATTQLYELMAIRKAGFKAAILFAVMHSNITRVFPSDHIDKPFGWALRAAIAHGVTPLAYGATMTPESIVLDRPLQVDVPSRAKRPASKP